MEAEFKEASARIKRLNISAGKLAAARTAAARQDGTNPGHNVV